MEFATVGSIGGTKSNVISYMPPMSYCH